MKKLVILPFLFASLLMISCSKSNTTDPATELVAKSAMVSSGDWKVTLYLDSGKDETNDFSAFNFSFSPDGTLVASNGINTYSGTWSLLKSTASSDDNPSTDDKNNRMTISISGDKLMDKVSKKWVTEKVTETELRLIDDNTTSNEALVFGR